MHVYMIIDWLSIVFNNIWFCFNRFIFPQYFTPEIYPSSMVTIHETTYTTLNTFPATLRYPI